MVQITWQDETSSSNTVLLSSDQVRNNYGLTSWELSALTLPGCLITLALPRSAHLIVSFYRLVLGTLYPAYASYKAIRNKDVDEYVITIYLTLHNIDNVFFFYL